MYFFLKKGKLFFKKVIVLHHGDYNFLFWHLCQIDTFSNNLNDEEMTTFHLMRVMKYINSNMEIVNNIFIHNKTIPSKFP